MISLSIRQPSPSFPRLGLTDFADETTVAPPIQRPRFLSEADCQDIARRLAHAAEGGGYTTATIFSTWTRNVRWARNRLTTTGEVRNDYIKVDRNIQGAHSPWVLMNDQSDAALVAAARRAERLLRVNGPEVTAESNLVARLQNEPAASAALFFEATYQLDASRLSASLLQLAHLGAGAGLLSAGYVEVGAHSVALIDTLGHTRYAPYTTARLSVTVRDPKGVGSGWAGVDWPDWSRIDGNELMETAIEKCLKSRNPVAIEPGRYTAILDPQAVCDFVSPMMNNYVLNIYGGAEDNPNEGPFGSHPPSWISLKGQRVIDPRLTVSADPTDSELAFLPFNVLAGNGVEQGKLQNYETYHPVVWIKDGILTNMAYNREFGVDVFAENTGVPNSGAFRISVSSRAATSVDEMIATTKRGLLVSRFHGVRCLDWQAQLYRGYTRDGLWLIENGAISKAIKNLVFTESPLFALNNVEQVGMPQRVFHPSEGMQLREIPQPVIVPPMKIRDFSFTALTEAI